MVQQVCYGGCGSSGLLAFREGGGGAGEGRRIGLVGRRDVAKQMGTGQVGTSLPADPWFGSGAVVGCGGRAIKPRGR